MTDLEATLRPDHGQPARTIVLVEPDGWDDWLTRQPQRIRAAIAAHRVAGKAGTTAILPGEEAEDWSALAIATPDDMLWPLAKLAETLPADTYRLAGREPGMAAFGWALAQHRFARYRGRDDDRGPRVLLTGEPVRIAQVLRLVAATASVRDFVDTGAADLGPAELEGAAEALATAHGADIVVTRGDALRLSFPMVHIVGQAAASGREPRMIELFWGDLAHPRVAIVGKGVCFDSGGLDIKSSAGMRLMKKDMGGAAHALALAGLVMDAALPVRLHLLIPAVENAISGNAFRPGDVLPSRLGPTVENTNTDAEGRLVLADALARAAEEVPELILDFATLTGAARVALGPDLPAAFANDDRLAAELLAAGEEVGDPLWRLPLWRGYEDMLKSDVADLVNAPDSGFAGAVTAALFLQRFVPADIAWAHLDTFAWRPVARPGRPKGGEAYGLRASFRLLEARYGQRS
ncbi:leucyl aminopeptidase family protein [Sphingomonas bacterium]|uniref:leucyl aminopeptidase family protein n=1 Tax=Sphingomonas bacterium TaxID=1895847 RepID=UPI001575E1A0|nr:leucyl aminopeptidase family protein [Sphingomonas bacterium]